MGIAVKELLTLEYFKDYHVIAGKSGLHKEIQGTTLLEAPDALRWAKGKELILSSRICIRSRTRLPRRSIQVRKYAGNLRDDDQARPLS